MDQQKLQEIQFIEQSLQQILMQKQAYQMELSETKAALKELEASGDESYKVIGQIMVKVGKDKIRKDLEEKEKLLDIRLKSMEKQESQLSEQLQSLRDTALKEKKK